ncbi:MAG: hypothetical protein JWN86_3034 [Planctomycetota bacterium]|nr:hypothetical protein [Planctomycetota bacterium]
MERDRTTLARLMLVVGVIAVEFAGFRAFYLINDELALALALTGLASQFALVYAIRGRGLARAFWAGFVAIGSVMMATTAWAFTCPGSDISDLWSAYTDHVVDGTAFVSYELRGFPQDVALSVVWFLPQLLAALSGGALATLVMRWCIRRADESRLGPATA